MSDPGYFLGTSLCYDSVVDIYPHFAAVRYSSWPHIILNIFYLVRSWLQCSLFLSDLRLSSVLVLIVPISRYTSIHLSLHHRKPQSPRPQIGACISEQQRPQAQVPGKGTKNINSPPSPIRSSPQGEQSATRNPSILAPSIAIKPSDNTLPVLSRPKRSRLNVPVVELFKLCD